MKCLAFSGGRKKRFDAATNISVSVLLVASWLIDPALPITIHVLSAQGRPAPNKSAETVYVATQGLVYSAVNMTEIDADDFDITNLQTKGRHVALYSCDGA